MKLWVVMAIMMCEWVFAPSVQGVSLDVSAISTSQTRSVFASGTHLHEFYSAAQRKTSQIEIAGKYAKTEGRDPTYATGVSTVHYFPVGLTVDSDFTYYQSHTTFAGGAGIGYSIASLGLGSRIEFSDAGGRQTFLRAVGILRGTTEVGGRRLSVSLKGEALRGKRGTKRADYWIDLRYRIGKHFNVGFRFEEVRNEKTQAAVLGISFL